MGQNFICKYLIIFLNFFSEVLSLYCHFGLSKPNWWALKLGEIAVLGMQLGISLLCLFVCLFVLLLALSSVNFDVCWIDFVMLLLNGVPF